MPKALAVLVCVHGAHPLPWTREVVGPEATEGQVAVTPCRGEVRVHSPARHALSARRGHACGLHPQTVTVHIRSVAVEWLLVPRAVLACRPPPPRQAWGRMSVRGFGPEF